MIKFRCEHVKGNWLYAFLGRQYSSVDGGVNETIEPTKRICKILASCPKVGLDTALDQSGITISSSIIEEVLQRFQNAGLLTYRFFEWAGKQRHYQHNIKAYHIMIESLAKIRQYKVMWDLVNIMRSKNMLNIETFCIIMRKYARAKKVEEAVYTFNVMEKYDVKPNTAAFNGLLSALCKSKNVRKAQEIFDNMKEQFHPDSKTYCILLEGWGKAPNLPKAREIFSQMIEPDIVTYGVMIDILSKAGRVDEAVEIVKDMDSKGCRPTSYIYSVLVHTYGLDNRIQDAVDTFLEMESNGVKPDVVVYNALISSFCKVNKFENISRVLNDMNLKDITPNSRTFNMILRNLIDKGKTDEASRVFRKMMRICDPDADTYTMMIRMFCGRNGEVEMAENVWRYMKSKQFVPSMHTFSALIDGMCEAGKVSRACVLMEEMIERGIRPSNVTFRKLRQLLLKEGREDVLEFINEKLNLMVKEPLCD